MARNTKILSDKELFEKTNGIVEHAINEKINLTFKRGDNYCQYHRESGNKKSHEKVYTINIATPAVKGINKYTALLHELGHVLYKSPFTPIKKLLGTSKKYSKQYPMLETRHVSRNAKTRSGIRFVWVSNRVSII